jgi:integrase
MTAGNLSFREFRALSPIEKAKTAVSVDISQNGTPVVVSRFGDDIWDFYPLIPQDNLSASVKRILWDVVLPDGKRLTDAEFASLLMASKEFIWSLYAEPVEGKKRPSLLTIIHKYAYLRHLLYWMTKNNVRSFSELTGRTFEYCNYLKHKKNKPLKPGTLLMYLGVVENLYKQRDKLNDAIRTHPWPLETTYSLSGILQSSKNYRIPSTEFIPDDFATLIAQKAIDYVVNKSDYILKIEEFFDPYGKISPSDQLESLTANISEPYIISTKTILNKEKILLRTACYIIIAMFSGIRDSEIKSLETDCVIHRPSKDGLVDTIWIKGMIYKTGLRQKLWQVPPIVETAINVLTRLSEPLRYIFEQEEKYIKYQSIENHETINIEHNKRINTIKKQKNKLFIALNRKYGKSISVINGSTINHNIQHFCEQLLSSDSSESPFHLHPHQFRRTYARFIARSELGDLLALREHFGHWSLDMTTYYADGGADEYESDIELIAMVTQEKQTRQSEIMTGLLDSEAPLAKGGEWLKAWRSSVRTAENKEKLIAEYSGSITLNGTGHSWCVGNARGTGCGGLCIFEAQMCVDCQYGIIGPEHRPVWEGIRDQQKEALALDDMGESGRARAQLILDKAETVLRRLEASKDQ